MGKITKKQVLIKLHAFIAEADELKANDNLSSHVLTAGCYDRYKYQGWVSSILTVLKSCKIDAAEVDLIVDARNFENIYDKHISLVVDQLKRIINGITEDFIQVSCGTELDCEESLEIIFDKFHKVVRQLRTRHNKRSTLEVTDEYDVQDLLHALLTLHFDDIRPEEWTPSYAGGSLRMDFLLKDFGIVIEVKKTRESMTAKDLGEQLIIDREKYKTHPDCRKIYCFVYDPQGYLGNPIGIKRDLEKGNEDYIKVFIRP